MCRLGRTAERCYRSNHYIPITGLNLSINNKSQLCANWSQEYLYRVSKRNGLRTNWLQFSGSQVEFQNQASQTINTAGAPVILSPSDLGLGTHVAGELGQFTCRFQVNHAFPASGALTGLAANSDPIGAGDDAYEVEVYSITSGIMSLVSGSSTIQYGVISELEANEKFATKDHSIDELDNEEVERRVGYGVLDGIGSLVAKHPAITNAVKNCAMGAISGAGQTGAGITGAGRNPMKDYF